MITVSLYRYIWYTSRKYQIRICLLVAVVAPLTMVPLELQRQIVDHAVGGGDMWLLAALGGAYLAVILVQGGMKYILNVTKGRVLEEVTRDLRRRILAIAPTTSAASAPRASTPRADKGTTLSVLSAESEDVGGFASESLSTPLLQTATILWVFGYLSWVEPPIAALAVAVYAPQAFLVPQVQGVVNRLARRRIMLVRKLGRRALRQERLAEIELSGWLEEAGDIVERIFKTRMLIYRYKYFLTFLGNFLDALGPLVVLMAGGYLVIKGQTDISTLVVFISGFQKLSDPWDQLVNFYRTVSNARVSYGLVAAALGDAASPGETALPVA
jgi:ABC-type multidrug transport system fused ATPase/permease subunit